MCQRRNSYLTLLIKRSEHPNYLCLQNLQRNWYVTRGVIPTGIVEKPLLVVSGQAVSMSTVNNLWMNWRSHVLRKRHLNLNYLSHARGFKLYLKVHFRRHHPFHPSVHPPPMLLALSSPPHCHIYFRHIVFSLPYSLFIIWYHLSTNISLFTSQTKWFAKILYSSQQYSQQ